MTAPAELDPFADTSEKRPAVSFKDKPIGTTYTLTVDEAPKMAQLRKYGTTDPDFWEDGNPKMGVVVAVKLDGEARSLWAPKPSAMFTAIAEAQKTAGAKIEPGATLIVRFDGEKPSSKGNPQKLYKVKLTPAAPAPAPDPFGDDPAPF